MADQDLFLNRAIVFISAVVYWAGVFVQARRVRRRIGHSPNVKPRGTKEKVLWVGWFLVVLAWLALPFLARTGDAPAPIRIIPQLSGLVSFVLGTLLVVGGYLGTLWCYSAMGNTWRMGVDRAEKTTLVKHGPYRFIRHPIYGLQIYMLIGVALLLPAPLAIILPAVHSVCALVKALDEEKYLRTVHGQHYDDYLSRRGRFFPKLLSSSGS